MPAAQTMSQTKAYLRTKVLTASPAELRLMLLDGAIRFAEQAREAMGRSNFEQVYVGASKCQDILMELINSLRPEHNRELCERLSGLYTYLYTRIIAATSQRDPAIVDEVLRLLRYERETWMMLLDQLAGENARAGQMLEAPDAAVIQPPNDGNESAQGKLSDDIVGGRVSVRG